MTRRQRAIAFFVTLCVLLVAAAVALIVGWVIANAERATPLVFGIISFALIIAGLIVYTVFLVLEIKRNEDHDIFINAVTHELKTPIASMRLYLQTLQTREVDEVRRREFYEKPTQERKRKKAAAVKRHQKRLSRDIGAPRARMY